MSAYTKAALVAICLICGTGFLHQIALSAQLAGFAQLTGFTLCIIGGYILMDLARDADE